MVSFVLKGLGFCYVLSMSLCCMPFTFIQGLSSVRQQCMSEPENENRSFMVCLSV